MEFRDVIKNRYSCKKFSDKKISKEQLELILEAGRLAPTAKNIQEHHVYVFESEEALEFVDQLTPCRYGAQTVLAVTYNEGESFVYPGEKKNSGVEDATIVATHMMLAAADLGIDSCWLNFFNPDDAAAELELAEGEGVLMFLDLGYAAEDAAPLPNHEDRKPLDETVTYL